MLSETPKELLFLIDSLQIMLLLPLKCSTVCRIVGRVNWPQGDEIGYIARLMIEWSGSSYGRLCLKLDSLHNG